MRHLAPLALLGALCVFGARQAVASEHAIVGTWKLVSFQTIVDNEAPQNLYGSQPRDYLILTREGRMMAITTAENRKGGMSDAERAALHKTLVAYSGRYRIEGSDFITTVDASWNESWNGTQQRRHYRFEVDKLFIETVPQPSVLFAGRTTFSRVVYEREK